VQGHPKLGASWEGFALERLLTMLESRDQDGVRLNFLLSQMIRKGGNWEKKDNRPVNSSMMFIAECNIARDDPTLRDYTNFLSN